MSSSLWIVIFIAVILVLIAIYLKFKTPDTPLEKETERTCPHCLEVIPKDYKKSLCPHCRKFII